MENPEAEDFRGGSVQGLTLLSRTQFFTSLCCVTLRVLAFILLFAPLPPAPNQQTLPHCSFP